VGVLEFAPLEFAPHAIVSRNLHRRNRGSILGRIPRLHDAEWVSRNSPESSLSPEFRIPDFTDLLSRARFDFAAYAGGRLDLRKAKFVFRLQV
jgi:hypothetical protein